jgi:hypothetical protein
MRMIEAPSRTTVRYLWVRAETWSPCARSDYARLQLGAPFHPVGILGAGVHFLSSGCACGTFRSKSPGRIARSRPIAPQQIIASCAKPLSHYQQPFSRGSRFEISAESRSQSNSLSASRLRGCGTFAGRNIPASPLPESTWSPTRVPDVEWAVEEVPLVPRADVTRNSTRD